MFAPLGKHPHRARWACSHKRGKHYDSRTSRDWHHRCVRDRRLDEARCRISGLTTSSQPRNEPLGSTTPTGACHGQPQAPTARQRGCPFLSWRRQAGYESPHAASCSLDVRMGPLRSGRPTTHVNRFTRGRCFLGLSQPGSIPRDTIGHQARVRGMPGLDPRCATGRVILLELRGIRSDRLDAGTSP
jgi:hypothetical protein